MPYPERAERDWRKGEEEKTRKGGKKKGGEEKERRRSESGHRIPVTGK